MKVEAKRGANGTNGRGKKEEDSVVFRKHTQSTLYMHETALFNPLQPKRTNKARK